MIVVITLNSFFIIKTNEKMVMSGNIMKGFVADMRKFKDDISTVDHLYFINFPISPINSLDAVFVEFLLHEPLNFMDDLEGYKEPYNYFIFLYTQGKKTEVYLNWLNDRSFIIGGLNADSNFVIPAKVSTDLEKEIEKVYTIKPHAQLRPANSIGEIRENINSTFNVTKLNKKSKKLELRVELKEQFLKTDGKTMFFLFNDGHFHPVKEVNFGDNL